MQVNKKTKKWLIALSIPILIYFIWGYFGFVGGWIPGKYDSEKSEYRIFGIFGVRNFYTGPCPIMIYTPFKRYGMIDTTGKIIIPFKFADLHSPYYANRNLIFAEDLNNKVGAINKKEEIIIPFEYDKLKRRNKKMNIQQDNYIFFGSGDFGWMKDGKFALFDTLGKQILPPEYSLLRFKYSAFSAHTDRWEYSRAPYFIADKGNHCYFVLENGDKIRYDFISINSWVINPKRKELYVKGVPTEYLDENLWKMYTIDDKRTDKYNRVSINEMKDLTVYHGLFDSLGKEILPLEYDKIERYQDRNDLEWDDENLICYRVLKNGKWGVYNVLSKKWVLPLQFTDITIFDEKLPLIKARKNDTENYTYYDLNGTLILSENVAVDYQSNSELIFLKNKQRYLLEYNKNKQKFIWSKL